MKKLVFVAFISYLVVTSVYGVTRLTFEQHALRPDIHNIMVLTQFQDPGAGGADQIWNFSDLKLNNDFKGLLLNPKYMKNSFFSNQFNTELVEFGNSFYFNIDNNKIELTGFKSSNGNMEIDYSKPFVKMVYPFEYGNSFNGNFSGKIKSGNLIGEINGTYDVEADGFGKLILPDNTEINDVLRVKTVKKYTQTFSSSKPSEVTVTTYRWYNQSERYPLLVFITTEYNNNGNVSVTHQAAYKNQINIENTISINGIINSKVYPNPFRDKLYVSYDLETTSNVSIEIFDVTGRKVSDLFLGNIEPGFYEEPLSIDNLGLKNGIYNIRVSINGKQENHRLMYNK